ncbi:MAG: hypothetical protein AAF560_16425, partial [Acidobacteriota bacterium]
PVLNAHRRHQTQSMSAGFRLRNSVCQLRQYYATGHMPSNLSMSAVGDKLFAALAGGSSGTSIYLPTNEVTMNRLMRNRSALTLLLGILSAASSVSCAQAEATAEARAAQPANPGFGSYWYQGKAEITSYQLEQARYGEVHPGHAVLIYVTEDFSREKHVKLDRPRAAGEDRVPILKLNFTKSFNTGIYPYSMMSSIFSPVDPVNDPRMLKSTTTSQEWCGHTFTQLNREADGYRIEQRSYFEAEGDENLTLEGVISEDEVWTTIRLNPANLPTGRLQMLPGSMYARLRHVPFGLRDVEAKLESAGNGLMAYSLAYPALDRTLTIHYRAEFPYEIEGWVESYRSGFGSSAPRLTTRATKNERLLNDYWNNNSLSHAGLRGELGLE